MRVLPLVALAAVLAGAPGCGGDDGEEEPERAEPREPAAVEGPGGTLEVAARPGHKDVFVQKRLRTRPGRVVIKLDIPTPGEGHNVQIEESPKCCTLPGARYIGGTSTILEGESTTATVNLKPGKYWFYCSVGGHWQRGMQGPLIVE